MARKIKLEDKEYDVEHLSDSAKVTLTSLQFVSSRIKELSNMSALLQRAKNSYVNSLKKEMLTEKAGIILEDD
jgi:ppGpp synthetase/RelA/SpoT-type nucleotidyltranferase